MARKTTDNKCEIMYEEFHGLTWKWIQAGREDDAVYVYSAAAGSPELTLNQMDKFADKLKLLVQDAREAV